MTACALAAQSRDPYHALAIFNASPDKSQACRASLGRAGTLAHIAAKHRCGAAFLSNILPFPTSTLGMHPAAPR